MEEVCILMLCMYSPGSVHPEFKYPTQCSMGFDNCTDQGMYVDLPVSADQGFKFAIIMADISKLLDSVQHIMGHTQLFFCAQEWSLFWTDRLA